MEHPSSTRMRRPEARPADVPPRSPRLPRPAAPAGSAAPPGQATPDVPRRSAERTGAPRPTTVGRDVRPPSSPVTARGAVGSPTARGTGPAGRPARLTAFGSAVVVGGATLAGGVLDALFLRGLGPVFGVVFVLACTVGALWVRSVDLLVPPVAAPLAFALTVLVTGDSGKGVGDKAMALFTGLAVNAGWLFLGTTIAGALAAVRHLATRLRRHD